MRIGLTKDGWPKRLSFLKPLVDKGGAQGIKMVLTILNFSRSWELTLSEWERVDPKFSNIIKPQSRDLKIRDKYFYDFVKSFKLRSPAPKFDFRDIKMSLKAGPQGPATKTAMMNLMVYNETQKQLLRNLTDEMGIEFLDQSLKHSISINDIPNYPILGKFSFVKDPEAKLRVIAISDFYTQLILKPIHNQVLRLLKGINCDRTFTQNPMHKWLNNGESFYSLDLSAATDRFPISLQEQLLSFIWNDKIASSWRQILSEREFAIELPSKCHPGAINKNWSELQIDTYKYACGQPMGTYSSWAVFTLTHHFIVYYCARLCGFNTFNQYIILGDDIVIKNDDVAARYREIMEALGVEISVQKTHVSKDTYEFAKRWIRPFGNVKELTGIPLKGIISNFKDPHIVFTILYDFFKIKRNISFSTSPLVNFMISRLYNSIYIIDYKKTHNGKKGKPFKRYLSINKRLYKTIRTLELALDHSFGYLTYQNFRRFWLLINKNDDIVVPSNLSIGLLKFKRILIGGIASHVSANDAALMNNLWDQLWSQFFESYKVGLSTLHPQLIGLYNLLLDRLEVLNSFNFNDNDINLYNVAKKVTSIKIDNIFNKDKEKILPLLEMGTIIKKGFHNHDIFSNEHVIKNSHIDPELDYFEIITSSYEELIHEFKSEFLRDHIDHTLEIEYGEEYNQNSKALLLKTISGLLIAMFSYQGPKTDDGLPVPCNFSSRWLYDYVRSN
jgi:hypothetical protein